ncbi:MAG: sterol-binding protein [Pseudonocardiales bacterium]|nr:MAG: sterol-binding protein [Pseudonocardiales bacterium]
MADIDGIDPRTVSPEEFARLIKHASPEQLDAVLDDPLRRAAVLDGVFSRMAGQFRPENAPGRDSAIHWRITGSPNGDDVYETWITGARGSSTPPGSTPPGSTPQCSTSKEPSHDPRLTLTMAADQFLALVSGNSAPTMMFITGKVKLDGDIGFAANLTKIFDMPQA